MMRLTGRAGIGDHVIGLSPSPDGQRVAAVSVSGALAVVERATSALLWRRETHGVGATSVDWHPSNPRILSTGQDGYVRAWDDRGTIVWEAEAGDSWVQAARWSPDGQWCASAAGRNVRLWTADGTMVREWPKHRATVADIRWHPTRPLLAAATYGGIVLLDIERDAPARTFDWKGSSLVACWSPTGKYLATGEQDSSVHFWITATGKDLQMTGYPGKVLELAWDHTGGQLATGGSAEVCIWDCSGRGPAGRKPTVLSGHRARVSAVAFESKGNRLASGGDDGRVVLWRTAPKSGQVAALDLGEPVTQLLWTRDNAALMAGGARGGVFLIQV